MHTLFALEDLYGIKIDEVDGEPVIRLNTNSREFSKMFDMFKAWQKEAEKWRNGEITKEDYDQWRYRYPLPRAEQFHKELSEKRKTEE